MLKFCKLAKIAVPADNRHGSMKYFFFFFGGGGGGGGAKAPDPDVPSKSTKHGCGYHVIAPRYDPVYTCYVY